eukprot:4635091-Pleurochrysis_carterae.AAC.4
MLPKSISGQLHEFGVSVFRMLPVGIGSFVSRRWCFFTSLEIKSCKSCYEPSGNATKPKNGADNNQYVYMYDRGGHDMSSSAGRKASHAQARSAAVQAAAAGQSQEAVQRKASMMPN